MSKPDISDLRFSSSSIDDFFADRPAAPRTASAGRVRIASAGELSGFERVSSDTLVRISKQDFWRLGQDGDGFFIERLVDDSESPVKG